MNNTPIKGGRGGSICVLKLYITGATPHSMTAVANIRNICKNYSSDCYTLDIIDVHQQPGLAKSEDIIAVPTLIKECSGSIQRLIGDLSDTKKVMKFLGIETSNKNCYE